MTDTKEIRDRITGADISKRYSHIDYACADLLAACDLADSVTEQLEQSKLTAMRFHKDTQVQAEKIERLSNTLDDIARQNLICEMEPENRDGADYEHAYECMIRAARDAIEEAKQ